MLRGSYVALGSSMAAGPGITPRVAHSPRRAGRSQHNYPHLVAQALQLDLTDVTYSGATTANLLHEPQHGTPPQIEALQGDESLVTVTIGGNDIGYVPLLMAASLPAVAQRLPVLGPALQNMLDPGARERALADIDGALRAVGSAVRARAPQARVLFVDYLTLLPPAGQPAPPLAQVDADLGRRLADHLRSATAAAAAATGCEVVGAAEASRDHHAWSAAPWTVGARFPVPRRPAPFHPNAAGMAAVAEMVVSRVRSGQ
ncbi:SGNH/GDSL hydrolase family protein [Mycolicibacterium mengxianglii]|uniref:SGNH/GDSL hydrolase family protein n=1 Tax=Mycolicibacterium mengxianglii TaxID=2736649 RepID=UPI0018D04A00|nr:SGNH/GDSL hydrolase family protein [Mycolicibacterium mengxianglii]